MAEASRKKSDYIQNVGKMFAILLTGFSAISILFLLFERLGITHDVVAPAIAGLGFATAFCAALLARTGRSHTYLAANQEIPAIYNGMASAASWMAPTLLLSLASGLYASGFDALTIPLGMMAGLVLAGILIAPYLNRAGALTVPDFFGRRYGPIAQALAALVMIAALFPMLVGSLTYTARFLAPILAVPIEQATWIAGASVFVLTVLGGMRSVTWCQAVLYVFVLAAVCLPLAVLSTKSFGIPLSWVTYGEAIQNISTLEVELIEKGLAEAGTMTPHVAPFSIMDPMSALAVVMALMVGTAAFGPMLSRSLTVSDGSAARLSSAWSAFFALLLVLTLPAWAAFTKLEIYSTIAKGIPVNDPPIWFLDLSRSGNAEIHGVSLRAFDDAISAAQTGARDSTAVEIALRSERYLSGSPFLALEPSQKDLLVQAAAPLATASMTEQQILDVFRKDVMPAAAKIAGNETNLVPLSALKISPVGIMILGSNLATQSGLMRGLLVLGLVGACLAASAGLLFTIASALGHDIYHRMIDRNATEVRRISAIVLSMLITIGGVGFAHRWWSEDLLPHLAWGLGLGAAGLLPALILGIWWKRTSTWGAVAGSLTGVGIYAAYIVASRHFPVALYDMWPTFAMADETARASFDALKAAWDEASGEAKSLAWIELDTFARAGTAPGAYPLWLHPQDALAMLVAFSFGMVITMLTSLVSSPHTTETINFVRSLRSPTAEPTK